MKNLVSVPKILHTKQVFSATLFTVDEITFLSSSGKKKTHHVVKRNPSVSIFPLDEEGNIYLVSEYRMLFQGFVLEAAAGHIEDNETPLESAKRELQEETGIIAKDWKPLHTVTMASSVINAKAHLFLARELSFFSATPEDDEHIRVIKMPLSHAVEKVVKGEINNSVAALGILLLEKLQRKKKV